MDELKPCPFCGGKAIIWTWSVLSYQEGGVCVRCTKCKCQTFSTHDSDFSDYEKSYYQNAVQIITSAWNRRVTDG